MAATRSEHLLHLCPPQDLRRAGRNAIHPAMELVAGHVAAPMRRWKDAPSPSADMLIEINCACLY